ncbi:DUF5682 family protein [Paenibacillus sp. CAU 1782]
MSAVGTAGVHVFGVRHLSPGGAWHLLRFLDEIKPTAVLVEGPSDASSEIRHIVRNETVPPIAILAYTDQVPVHTVLWPFAAYSPEYAALKWADRNGAESAFIDLPSSVTLAMRKARDKRDLTASGEPLCDHDAETVSETQAGNVDVEQPVGNVEEANEYSEGSLYERVAVLAGEPDYDTYWERHYEHNMSPDVYRQTIKAFSSSMRNLTIEGEQEHAVHEFAHNAVRESYMKRGIQEMIDSGHEPGRIVVVCGAYHAEALESTDGAMTDAELKTLPVTSSKLTMMPYSYFRLSSLSGYGAGNNAPGYYEAMWRAMQEGALNGLPHVYLSAVAARLRETGTFRSTAEVIEAVRLAESLAALHGGSQPALIDLRDAAKTLLGRGELSVVAEALAFMDVGTGIGALAEGVSQTPVQDDLNRQLKELKLDKYRTAVAQELALDLRENRRVKSEAAAFLDLNRSFLLHRLSLIGILLAQSKSSGQQEASWAEHWVLQWSPEAEIQTVEASLMGESIEIAAARTLSQKLSTCTSIAEASKLIRTACLCGMASQLDASLSALDALAADSRDVVQLAAAISELSGAISYGDVRRMDTAPLLPLLEKLFLRASLFLLEASGCNDEAATGMIEAIGSLHNAAQEHGEQVDEELWLAKLSELSARDDRNPRLSGLACAILMERGVLSADACEQEVSRRLSPGIPAELGAGWFEGLAQRNRYALVSRIALWEQLNAYIAGLEKEQFARALVFLRRAFSVFAPREKTMVAEVLGELWGVDSDQAAELLSGELNEQEEKQIEELNEFDFEDF